MEEKTRDAKAAAAATVAANTQKKKKSGSGGMNRRPKPCEVCGKEFRSRHDVCFSCRQKAGGDIEAAERKMLMLTPSEDKEYERKIRRQRVCHTCGKPSGGMYWCDRCRAKRQAAAGYTSGHIDDVWVY